MFHIYRSYVTASVFTATCWYVQILCACFSCHRPCQTVPGEYQVLYYIQINTTEYTTTAARRHTKVSVGASPVHSSILVPGRPSTTSKTTRYRENILVVLS